MRIGKSFIISPSLVRAEDPNDSGFDSAEDDDNAQAAIINGALLLQPKNG